MNKIINGISQSMTGEEAKKQKSEELQDKQRSLTESEIFVLFAKQQINTLSVDDDTALRMKSYYPTWRELTEQQFTAENSGYKFTYGDDLYKTRNDKFTFQSQWIPGQGTSAIFVQIVETHAGTLEDPIPVPDDVTTNAFEYENGKYYIESDKIYLCKRDKDPAGEKYTLTYPPSQLVGHYFETV